MNGILASVGGTPMVELTNVVPGGCARMFVKVESHNPTGSMKDRMALSVIDGAAASAPLAEEVWVQSGGSVDAFVQAVGTAQCIAGVAAVLRSRNSEIEIVAVEPAESPVLSGGVPGAHKIEGIGPGFVPPLWDDLTVSTSDAKAMSRRLAKEEALFAGTSSGANVAAALRVAKRLGPGRTVVTVICDSGLKYLSTDLYSARSGDH